MSARSIASLRLEVEWLMKRCQRGVGGRDALDDAHSIMADCYGTLGLLLSEVERLDKLLNTPELRDFSRAVVLEAAHQRERWGVDHDAGKEPEDWFWLLGYLGGKALAAQRLANTEKALHHTISAAAALANWHAAISGADNSMRPGTHQPLSVQAGVSP